ncbi:hypothetical protein CDD82_5616 [Ophiocordyceps australis]|uniref:Uncharacterized protein n=1 Tax=Ophiocordyceps australis TaxID=1399860 RepID=A0A2C5Z1V0_9HYPO|nr:hypothetical protein CDD82_5616 [Ophiocordyceps australis]
MHRHGLHSIGGRARSSSTTRQLSTSARLLAAESRDDAGPGQKQTRTMVGSISSLARNNQAAQSRDGTPRPVQSPLGNGINVIDVKSLPRGFFRGRRARGGIGGRGSFRGRGGGAARGGAEGAEGIQEFRPGLRARGTSRGGKGRGRGRRYKDGEGAERKRSEEDDGFENMDESELEFDQAVTFGVPTRFNPSLTLESLTGLIPAAPSPTAGCIESTVLRNLSFLGMSDAEGAPVGHAGQHTAKHVVENGVHFFASLKERKWAEEYLQETRRPKPAELIGQDAQVSGGPAEDKEKKKTSRRRYIRPAGQTIRTAIMRSAVEGQYEQPLHASDPVGIARAMHLRSETYSKKDIEQFEEKLVSLISRTRNRNQTARPRA